MNTKLKKAIVDFIFEHDKEFQLYNTTKQQFRSYIYDDKGEYLIGGDDVSTFIDKAIELLATN